MTDMQDLGESRIIDTIISKLEKMPNMPIPFGDDVSAIEIDNDFLAVLKTDMLVGQTDIPPGMSLWQGARKAVVMNISDLASKGVKTKAILASIGLPRKTSKKEVEEIGLGLNAGAREYGAYVIGGDTNEASDIIISCTAFGIARKNKIITRSGARSGDILAVTGTFGKTSAGLKILLEEMKAPQELTNKLLKPVYTPFARLEEGLVLAELEAATASIDSSDGLAISLHHLMNMSNVGFVLSEIPIAPEVIEYAKIHNIDGKELALYGGEEYELIVTLKPEIFERAKMEIGTLGDELLKIGKVINEKKIVTENGKKILFRGWEHFRH